MGIGHQFAKVLVPFEILGDHSFVVDLVFGKIFRRRNVVLGNVANVVRALAFSLGPFRLFMVVYVVEFAADERFDIGCFAGTVEVDGAKEVSVVRHGQGWHA